MDQGMMTAAPEEVSPTAVRLVELSAVMNRVATGAVLMALGVLALSSSDSPAARVVGGALLTGGLLVIVWRTVQLSGLLSAVLNVTVFLVLMDTMRRLLIA